MAPSSLRLSRDRPRFVRFRLDRRPDGRCRARVTLTWESRGPVEGEAAGIASPPGELRCAVQACLNALAQGLPELAFEMVGVKAVRALDANVIIVSLAVKGLPGPGRLVGSYLAGQNLPRGAALAVLNAVNRIITRPAGT